MYVLDDVQSLDEFLCSFGKLSKRSLFVWWLAQTILFFFAGFSFLSSGVK
jgi:hypothetical protein